MQAFRHESVLLRETVEGLRVRAEGIYVDGTAGGGGHAEAVLSRLSGKGRLIGLDQDGDAVAECRRRLSGFGERVSIFRRNFAELPELLSELGIGQVDGICLDLGVSSYQFDAGERGFSYRLDAPLDMRMDRRMARTAADIVNEYDEETLCRVFREYGEEKFARQIARRIVMERAKKPITGTVELAGIIAGAYPAAARRREGGHPAKRAFQAIRIDLNQELSVLEQNLGRMLDCLSDGGRICVISFHSLEDRIVKEAFRRAEKPCTCPPDFPVCVCGKQPKGLVLTKKPVVPGEEEKRRNRRSQSAKLRIFERQYCMGAEPPAGRARSKGAAGFHA